MYGSLKVFLYYWLWELVYGSLLEFELNLIQKSKQNIIADRVVNKSVSQSSAEDIFELTGLRDY